MFDYYHLDQEQLGQNARIPLVKLGDSGEVFYEMALEMFETIETALAERGRCVLIVPVGPVGQYAPLIRLINRKRLSLKEVWFINMDEYLDGSGRFIDRDDRLSFRGFMERNFYGKITPDLLMPEAQRVFPDPEKLDEIPALIERLGGVDACFGGIGINGHVAFNEAEDVSAEEFLTRRTRVIRMADETWTVNAVGDLNGALECMPKQAVTIGFSEIYGSRKIRLYVFRDWHRAVVRRAAYGEPTARFPVTLLQNHPDVRICCNQNAAQRAF